jgi:DNA polymerase elongation subunit (family B)
MNRNALIFDIETIGDLTPENGDAIAAVAAGREQTPETYAALCPPLARVVCIACFDLGSQKLDACFDASLCADEVPSTVEVDDGTAARNRVACDLQNCAGEAAVLREFGRRVERHLGQPDSQLVTYNGRGFDLPVLIHRSIKHGVTEGRALLVKAMGENRYRAVTHLDLMEVVTFNGASSRWPLATYAMGYGLQSPKTEMDGARVSAAVQAGRIIDVARYCARDVLATVQVYHRTSGLLTTG